METNTKNEVSFSISALLDKHFGKKGTASRIEAEKRAYNFYINSLLKKPIERQRESRNSIGIQTKHK